MRIIGKASITRFITVFYFLENSQVINKIVDSRNAQDMTSKYTQMIRAEGDNVTCYDNHVDALECNNFTRIGISKNWDGEQFPYIVYYVNSKELWVSNDHLLTESDKVILTLNGVTLYDYENSRLS